VVENPKNNDKNMEIQHLQEDLHLNFDIRGEKIPNVANCQTIFSSDEKKITLNLGWVSLWVAPTPSAQTVCI
jgi:hypothetical protein